jgi:hypothetical protein
MARMDSTSSTLPQPSGVSPDQNGPPIAQHPIPSALTSIPERPKARFMICLLDISLVYLIGTLPLAGHPNAFAGPHGVESVLGRATVARWSFSRPAATTLPTTRTPSPTTLDG